MIPVHVNIVQLHHPKIRQIADRVLRELQLVAEKAVACQAKPDEYNLPTEDSSLEAVFLRYFTTLPKEKQRSAIDKLLPRLRLYLVQDSVAEGDLDTGNLRSAKLVSSEVKAHGFPPSLQLTATDLANIASELAEGEPRPELWDDAGPSRIPRFPRGRPRVPTPIPPTPPSRLDLWIRDVHCDADTDESFQDEIYLGGYTIDNNANIRTVDPRKVGDFETNEVENPRFPFRFATFPFIDDTWPKVYFAGLVLCEKRDGGLTEFLAQLTSGVQQVVHETLEAAGVAVGASIGAVGGAVVGGPVGALPGAIAGAVIGWLTGYVLGELFNWLTSWWDDEDLIFDPLPLIRIDVPADYALSGRRSIVFTGDEGRYTLLCSWRLR